MNIFGDMLEYQTSKLAFTMQLLSTPDHFPSRKRIMNIEH